MCTVSGQKSFFTTRVPSFTAMAAFATCSRQLFLAGSILKYSAEFFKFWASARTCAVHEIDPHLGAIHSTKLSENFGPKLNGSVRSNRKNFEKTGPPFEVVLFSRSDRLEFWLNGSRPKTAGNRMPKKLLNLHRTACHRYRSVIIT